MVMLMSCVRLAARPGFIAMLTVFAALAGDAASHTVAATDYGQITLVNQTSVTLDFYYDGVYGCRALNGLTCTSQVPAGGHNLTATTTDNRSVGPEPMTLDAGGTYTWTITEQSGQ